MNLGTSKWFNKKRRLDYGFKNDKIHANLLPGTSNQKIYIFIYIRVRIYIYKKPQDVLIQMQREILESRAHSQTHKAQHVSG